MAGLSILVGAAGFEPTLTESESGVLPLNYAPSVVHYIIIFFILQHQNYTMHLPISPNN